MARKLDLGAAVLNHGDAACAGTLGGRVVAHAKLGPDHLQVGQMRQRLVDHLPHRVRAAEDVDKLHPFGGRDVGQRRIDALSQDGLAVVTGIDGMTRMPWDCR